MNLINIELIVEKGDDGIWGRVEHNGNLIVEEAENLEKLQINMKSLLKEFEQLEIESIEFDIRYDVYALFQQFDFLNISKVASYAKINPGLLRQYAAGIKSPSLTQAKKIEVTLHDLADNLKKASVYAV